MNLNEFFFRSIQPQKYLHVTHTQKYTHTYTQTHTKTSVRGNELFLGEQHAKHELVKEKMYSLLTHKPIDTRTYLGRQPSIMELFSLKVSLSHLFPIHPFSTPEKIKKPSGFLMISGGREREHWEQIGYRCLTRSWAHL